MKAVGILGGMGSAATVDLFNKIVIHTDAKKDSEYIHVYIDNNPKIADRTIAILQGTKEPVFELVSSAKKLEAMGADVLVMPCNTAHFFYNDIIPEIKIPMLHMIDITTDVISNLGVKKIGLLATTGTLQSEIYHQALEEKAIEILVPSESEQEEVMNLIYLGMKANNNKYDIQPFISVIQRLLASGAEYIILGCTELPLAFSQFQELHNIAIIDPTAELAKAAIQIAGAQYK